MRAPTRATAVREMRVGRAPAPERYLQSVDLYGFFFVYGMQIFVYRYSVSYAMNTPGTKSPNLNEYTLTILEHPHISY